MPHIVILVSIVLLNWWSFRAVSRHLARKRQASATARDRRANHIVLPAPSAADSATSAAEPTARAFPIHGLPPGPSSASVLEALLRHMAGVTRAYVSPVTALAYVDYLPAQVTEEQLVGAIRGGGYGVGDAGQRFNWRHAHPS